jgi:hypothetical protein
MTGMTRGRLPARVYWVRRLMVLGIAALLVVGLARLLGGSSDGSSGPDRATRVAEASSAATTPSTSTTTSTTASAPSAGTQPRRHQQPTPTPTPTPVAMPSGPCAPGDIAISPSVPRPYAGRDISLVLDLSTLTTPACTWKVSGSTLALKITSGSDLIWTSVQCPRAIPTEDLVLRQSAPTRVRLTWDARRSEPGCPRLTDWARLGTYHLYVAALAGQPQEATFTLVTPPPTEITKTASPHPHRRHRKAG